MLLSYIKVYDINLEKMMMILSTRNLEDIGVLVTLAA